MNLSFIPKLLGKWKEFEIEPNKKFCAASFPNKCKNCEKIIGDTLIAYKDHNHDNHSIICDDCLKLLREKQ